MERPAARTFRDLVVWRKAQGLVLGVCRWPEGFPKHETYGLRSQWRRARGNFCGGDDNELL